MPLTPLLLIDLLVLINRWHAQKRTVLAVMHDIGLVRNHFPQAILLNGKLVAWDETEQVLAPYLTSTGTEYGHSTCFTWAT